MFKFTPRKFIDVLDLNNIKITHLVKLGIPRSYFIPRYKEGSKRKNELGNYQKKLQIASIKKLAKTLVDFGYFENEKTIINCFKNDNFEPLIPKELL